MWHCWQSESGSHTELWGGLACCLSTAEENNWWRFAHSPERYHTITKHSGHSRNQWCHPGGFREGGWQRGLADLGQWHSKPHHLYFKGHDWCTVVNKHPTYRTCKVICTSCSPYCAGLGVQTILSWRDEHRDFNVAFSGERKRQLYGSEMSTVTKDYASWFLWLFNLSAAAMFLIKLYLSRAWAEILFLPQPHPYLLATGQLWFSYLDQGHHIVIPTDSGVWSLLDGWRLDILPLGSSGWVTIRKINIMTY